MEATVTCPNGHVNPVGTEFCAECGQSLTLDKTSVWVVSQQSSQFAEQTPGGGAETADDEAEEDGPAPAAGPEPAAPAYPPEPAAVAAAATPPPEAPEPLTPEPPSAPEAPPAAAPPPPVAATQPSEPMAQQMSGRSIAALVAFTVAALAGLREIIKRRTSR